MDGRASTRQSAWACALVLGALLLFASVAGAAAPAVERTLNPDEEITGDFLISPDNKRIPVTEADLGTPISEQFLLFNRTGSVQTVDIQVGQIVGSTNPEQGFEIRHGVRQGAAAWVDIPVTNLTIKPRETVTIPFRITIPKDATAGDKAFTISATQQPPAVQSTGAQARFRLTTVFALELPGDAVARVEAPEYDLSPNLWIRGSDSFPAVTLSYENTGERFVRPEGTITVNPLFGQSFEYEVAPFTIYPEGVGSAHVVLEDLPSLGFATVSAKIDNNFDTDEFKIGNLWVLPTWWKWGAIGLALFLLWQTVRLVRWWRARRTLLEAWAEQEAHAAGIDTADVDEDDVDEDDDLVVLDDTEAR